MSDFIVDVGDVDSDEPKWSHHDTTEEDIYNREEANIRKTIAIGEKKHRTEYKNSNTTASHHNQ